MDYDKIKELISLIDASSLKEMEYSEGNLFIRLSKNETQTITNDHHEAKESTPQKPIEAAEAVNKTDEPAEKEAQKGKIVTSPIVGVVYLQASPEADQYVTVGQTISKGHVLCLVEAMKIMNEITSEYAGEIAEILVENGEVVEFNQPLFRII